MTKQLDDLVARFSVALLEKLRAAEQKYGYQNNWARDDWEAECQRCLKEHLAKGDPLDVAAYCAFLWHHGWSTVGIERREALEEAIERGDRYHAENDELFKRACEAESKLRAMRKSKDQVMTDIQEMLGLADELESLAEMLSKKNTNSDAGFDQICIRAAKIVRQAAGREAIFEAIRVLVNQTAVQTSSAEIVEPKQ